MSILPPDPVVKALRRRKHWRAGLIAAIVLIFLISIAQHLGLLRPFPFSQALSLTPYLGDDLATYDHKTFVVDNVVDGITLQITSANAPPQTTVRLLGIKSPTDTAKAWLEQRVLHKSVTLLLEPTQTRDPQGHLLAWVYVEPSDPLNTDMIRQGKSQIDPGGPRTFAADLQLAAASHRKRLAKPTDPSE